MKGAHILIVEDESLIAEDMRWQLVQMDYEVVGVADSGKEALLLAEALRPDLVMMDGTLRGLMDGFETGRQIEQLLGCPIVYVTANPQALSMRYSVGKPFTVKALASMVSEALAANAG